MPEANLELYNVIGFSGKIPAGLHVHPDGKHMIYPLGGTLIIRDIQDFSNIKFLHGHQNGSITCIAISKSGRYIASGQCTHMGFKADIIMWDYESKAMLHRMSLHKVKVEALAFSQDEQYLVSIGGQDDNNITVWDVSTGKPLCGAVSSNLGTSISFFNNDPRFVVTAGKFLMRVWEIDYENSKMTPHDCKMGQLKRIVTCLALDQDDQYLYCGTTSGDILCVQMQDPKNFKFSGPKKPIPKGVISIAFASDGNLIVGGGDGSLTVLNRQDLLKIVSKKLMGGVTSIAPYTSSSFFCGTDESVIYLISGRELNATLIATCHSDRINDVAYPLGTSEIIATCSFNDIRLWNAVKCKELLRIRVDNLECNCACFSPSGKSIISSWSDGRIRAFGPQSGKLLYVINDAHKISGAKISGTLIGVTAIATTSDGSRIISGGSDGQVRVWQITNSTQTLIASLKEHKATINSIHVKHDNKECVTASDDGSCIVWSLERFTRSNIMYAQTYFKQARYLNDESQILTCGSDKQITYWDAYDCSPIRELPESENGEINALDISNDGQYFISGGLDKHVNLWHYDNGEIIQTCFGHSDGITKMKFSPDSKYIASVGAEGAIFLWIHHS